MRAPFLLLLLLLPAMRARARQPKPLLPPTPPAGSPRRDSRRPLGFAGASSLEDGRPAAALEVDEYGVPRRESSSSVEEGKAREEEEDEEEEEGVYGDYIDEETQEVCVVAAPSSDASPATPHPAVTNASWRMVRWMRDYLRLMR